MAPQPALFISHGAPTLLQDDSPAHHFLKSLGRDILKIKKPDAIVIMSAHFERAEPTLTVHPSPRTLYDFHGFPSTLYQQEYKAPGGQGQAKLVQDVLTEHGFDAVLDGARGFDHGTWIPLSLMFPAADIPVMQLSINPVQTPKYHFLLGQSLSKLRAKNVLVIGSGNLTHNLHEYFQHKYPVNAPAPDWVQAFSSWLAIQIEAGDVNAVLNAVSSGPFGKRNHPTMDHIHPLFFAMGLGGKKPVGINIHSSISYGVLAMDVYAF